MTTPPPPGADDPQPGQPQPADPANHQAGNSAQPPGGNQAQPGQPAQPYPAYPQPSQPTPPGQPAPPGYPAYPQAGGQPGYPGYPQPGQPGYPAYPQAGNQGNQGQPPAYPSYPQAGNQTPPGYQGQPPPGYPQPGYPQPGNQGQPPYYDPTQVPPTQQAPYGGQPPGPYGNPALLPSGYPAYPQPGYPGYPTPNAGGGFAGGSEDPLVPRDFGGWFQRVFQVFRRSFGQLALLAVIPMVLFTCYLATIFLLLLLPGIVKAQMASGADASDPFTSLAGMASLWPVILIFMVLIIVGSAFQQAASIFVVVQDANGQRTTATAALRSAVPRVPRLIGWSLLIWLGSTIVLNLPMLPGNLTQSGVLTGLGVLVTIALAVVFYVVIFASLFGVLVIERGSVARCLQLVKRRFWACLGRLTIAWLLAVVYLVVISIVIGLLFAVMISMSAAAGGPDSAPGSGTLVVIGVLAAVLILPVLIFQVAVSLVTYAELRFHENPATSTATLAAELAR